jgi:hypothetical protein
MTNDTADHAFDQRDTNIIERPFNPLPRSVVRRTPYELLDGEWRFALDPEDRGLRDGWHLKRDYTLTAQFPGAIEAQLAKAKVATLELHDSAPDRQEKIVAWYERKFTLSADWSSTPDRLTQLTFARVATRRASA